MTDYNQVETPAYLINVDRFSENFGAMLSKFKKYFNNSSISYSYKTNYARPIIETNKMLGGTAEVVSTMELQMALSIGHAATDIYFNGPLKTDADIEFCLEAGVNLNVDSLLELQKVIRFAEVKGLTVEVGMRLSFPDDSSLNSSRFGIEFPSDDFQLALSQIAENDLVSICGLHAHYPERDIATIQKTVGNLVDAAHLVVAQGSRLDYVSIGGGFSGPMNEGFARQLSNEERSFERYAEAAAPSLRRLVALGTLQNHSIELILEPGTALVGDAVDYICQVHSIKNRKDGPPIAVTDGTCFAMGGVPRKVEFPVLIHRQEELTGLVPTTSHDHEGEQAFSSIEVVGYTCVEGDKLTTLFNQRLKIGDYLSFAYQGAYSLVMRPPFIRMEEKVYVASGSADLVLVRGAPSTSFCFDEYAPLEI